MMAPIKRVPIDLITVKATELGASLLWPVVTQHAVVQRVNLRRMRANAVEAAEQCRRLSVPVCRSPTALAEALEGWPAGRALLVCDERGGSETIHQVLTRAKAESWAIMVGPEGGFHRPRICPAARSAAMPVRRPWPPYITGRNGGHRGVGLLAVDPRRLAGKPAAINELGRWWTDSWFGGLSLPFYRLFQAVPVS